MKIFGGNITANNGIAVRMFSWFGNSQHRFTPFKFLAVHALVWTLAAWLSRGNLDVAGDMVENYVWGIEWQAGYAKHPPLFAWVTAAWFKILPRQDWIYYGLSSVNAAIGLLGVAALARRFVSTENALIAMLALAVSPMYTAFATKFNANAILLSLWPWAAYFFVAFMQDGRWRHAIFCGVLIALSMMGKYFSVVLVLALCLTALARPNWRPRLWSIGTLLALAACGLVLLPHALWMIEHQFSTLTYASQRSDGTFTAALARYVKYVAAQIGYLLPGFGFVLLLVQRGHRMRAAAQMLRSVLYPVMHRDLWWLSFAPLIIVGLIAALAGTPMASVWGMAQWFAVTTLWLALLSQAGTKIDYRDVARVLCIYWALVIMISALTGFIDAASGSKGASEPRAELAAAAESLWRERTGRPLIIVGGSPAEASSIVFYASSQMHFWNIGDPSASPWITPQLIYEHGALLVCPQDSTSCQGQAQALAQAPATVTTLSKQSWGRTLPPYRYHVYFVLPR